jgi:hypothetical protein
MICLSAVAIINMGSVFLEHTIANFATFSTVVISVLLLLEIWLNMEHTSTV